MTVPRDFGAQLSKVQETKKTWKVGTLQYTGSALAVLFFWLLLGDFAWSMRERSVSPTLQLLLRKAGASDTLTGALMGSLPAAVTMLIGPIIGYLSDRHRGPWGRRIPFLLVPTPIAALAMVGLAFGPEIGTAVHRWFGSPSSGPNDAILVTLGLLWSFFEVAAVTANSVFVCLVNDVVPSEVLGRFFAMFRALGLAAAILFYFKMVGLAEAHYAWVFLGVALVYGGGFTAMCLNVREGSYPPVVAPTHRGDFLGAAKTYARDCFGRSYYLWYFGTMALATIANGPVNSFSIYYAQSLRLDIDAYGKCLVATYVVSLILAYPLGILVDRFHPLRVSLAAMALYVLVMLAGSLWVHDQVSFLSVLMAHGIAGGIFFTASASLGQRLLPRARFAELNSAATAVSCLASVILPTAVGLFLDHEHHAYRYTFVIGFGLAVATVAAFLVLHRKFMALGGPTAYRPPD